ncbi:MAG: aminomethyl-transferring glycine dehydrogenase subunit GcvPB [candidate division WOR-3 bacterium]|uniref:Probable glycine dehydrogenase (decarboxylating) subunit 2 n=1 Tax=candidate division WOR-3 bacterium TaxID=2052148 RepID=A0A7C1ND89_UNCW3|nr:aminomethyl-transferring glycine dehydrogenase subunit GcvPB [candidate division WOR-3 bacterium]
MKPEKSLFELSCPGRRAWSLPELDVPAVDPAAVFGSNMVRADNRLPELSEIDIIRHFTRLSTLNHHVDKGFYPLGSCTMKYNPKVNELTCRLPGFTSLHPYGPETLIQGALQLMFELGEFLKEITGFDAVTLQPAAGAHGELTGIMMVRRYFEKKGENRNLVLVPDSAHGTNPASVVLSGFQAVQIKSTDQGLIDPQELMRTCNNSVACLMVTNPNTLGLFESEIKRICEIMHEQGALVYLDGANLNAYLGIHRPADAGFDLMHINLHKTFSTPHGGGGPGAGPVAVKKHLEPFLPRPVIVKGENGYRLEYDRPDSIGRVLGSLGQFLVLVRAYTYIRMLGADGLKRVAECAVLNANYIRRELEGIYELPYARRSLHEVVFSGNNLKQHGVRTLDVAKRLLDFGLHAPTVYFPLIVPEALMIEPTETESKESLDEFVQAMKQIAEEARTQPEILHNAPHSTPVRRLDEARASRLLDVNYQE